MKPNKSNSNETPKVRRTKVGDLTAKKNAYGGDGAALHLKPLPSGRDAPVGGPDGHVKVIDGTRF